MNLKSLLATVLSASQEDQIPYTAQNILTILISNPSILDTDEQTQQKLRIRISAFLTSKSPVTRWFGCFLCKAVLQSSACWQMIKSHGAQWASAMQSLLERPEPIATHQIAIQAMSLIFSRTHGKTNMTREITTPRLPAYIKQLLALARKEIQLWPGIVSALKLALRQQSTTFRPNAANFHSLIMTILGKAVNESIDEDLLSNTCEAYVSLHMAAPKGKEAEEWRHSILKVISEIHITLTEMAEPFVKEDFDLPTVHKADNLEGLDAKYPVEKLIVFVKLLGTFFNVPTKVPVVVPCGRLMHLADRIYGLPFANEKPATDRDQKAMFFACIERAEIQYTKMLVSSCAVLGQAVLPYHDMLLHHAVVNCTRSTNHLLITEFLQLVTILLRRISTVSDDLNESLTTLVQVSMKLIEPSRPSKTASIPDFVTNPEAFDDMPHRAMIDAANSFLVTVVRAASSLPLPVRSSIDRYFILNRYAPGVATSAQYPSHLAKYSILPMALQIDGSNALIAGVHPRLPPLANGAQDLTRPAKVGDGSAGEGSLTEDGLDEPASKKRRMSDDRSLEYKSIIAANQLKEVTERPFNSQVEEKFSHQTQNVALAVKEPASYIAPPVNSTPETETISIISTVQEQISLETESEDTKMDTLQSISEDLRVNTTTNAIVGENEEEDSDIELELPPISFDSDSE